MDPVERYFSIKNHPWCNFGPRWALFFNQEPFLMQFRPLLSAIFQSRTILDAIMDPVVCYFSIKDYPWCNYEPCGVPFFNQGLSLMQLWTLWCAIFQSRTILDTIMNPVACHFSIKNHPWCNNGPCWAIFQSRTILDAIMDPVECYFSIKDLLVHIFN